MLTNSFIYSKLLPCSGIITLVFVTVVVQINPTTSSILKNQDFSSGFSNPQIQNRNHPSHNWLTENSTTGNFFDSQHLHNIPHSNPNSDPIQTTFELQNNGGYSDHHEQSHHSEPYWDYFPKPEHHHHEHQNGKVEPKKKLSGKKLAKIVKKTTGATKALKIGSAVIMVQIFLVVVALRLLSRSGGRLAPIAFPLALLPIGLIAAIPAISLFIATFSTIAVKDQLGLGDRRRTKRRHSRSDELNEMELLTRILEYTMD